MILEWYQSYLSISSWNVRLRVILFKSTDPALIGYANARNLFDLHKNRSQAGYVFICNGTIILWWFTKQPFVLLPPSLITQRSLRFMKQAEIVFGCDCYPSYKEHVQLNSRNRCSHNYLWKLCCSYCSNWRRIHQVR